MLPLKRGNMSQNPSVRRMHAHLCTFLYPSLLLACFHAPSFCLSLLHPHSPMCLHNHIVSHKHSMGEENEMVILVIGMCFSLNLTLELQSKPSHILATPQTSPPKKHGGRTQLLSQPHMHGSVNRSRVLHWLHFVLSH